MRYKKEVGRLAEQINNYQCPSCAGPLKFVGESGRLECEFCGSSYEVAWIEQMYAEKEEQAVRAFEENEKKLADQQEEQEEAREDTSWNLDNLGGNWGEDEGRMKIYNCPSCGAELICEETTAATSCPYCDNPTIIPGQFSGTIKPDYIIPFRLDKKAAVAALNNHCKGKILLPKEFTTNNHIEEVKGIYVPFWMFSAEADANIRFKATRTHVYTSGDYRVTRTDHYDISRSGRASFEKIPTDASKKMPDDYMDSLEPYDYSELTDFSTAYMPGYMADKYDVSAEESAKRADIRCYNSISEILRDDVSGYATVVERDKKINLNRGEVKYALLPVWILNTRWNGKNYMFAMNGQTGKIVGDLPISAKKLNIIRLAVGAGVALVAFLSGIGGCLASLIV